MDDFFSGAAEKATARHPAGRLYCSALEAGAAPAFPRKPQSRAAFIAVAVACALAHGAALVTILRAPGAPDVYAGPEAVVDLVIAPLRGPRPATAGEPTTPAPTQPGAAARVAPAAASAPAPIEIAPALAAGVRLSAASVSNPTGAVAPLVDPRGEIMLAQRTQAAKRVSKERLAATAAHELAQRRRAEQQQKQAAAAATVRAAEASAAARSELRRAELDREARTRRTANAAAYRRLVSRRIDSSERYPQEALSRRAQGLVRVRFEIGPTGAIAAAAIQSSSGDAALDGAALSAVRDAAPLPPPPPGAQRVYVAPISFHPG